MDPFGPGVGEAPGGLQGSGGHLVDGVEVPLSETDTAPVLHINGRQYDHRLSSPKFLKICSPTGPLFSGWNWQP